MNNLAVPYPMLQPTSGQQVPTNYFIASVQQHMIPPIHNYPSEDYTSQQLQRMTSTSEEEETQNSKNEWQDALKGRKYTRHNATFLKQKQKHTAHMAC